MARPTPVSRWPHRLAEAALLPALWLAAAVHAADAPPASAPAPIGADQPSLAGASGHDVYLDVTLNGAARGLVHFGDRARQLWASAASLRQLGFVLPPGTVDPVALAELPGLQVQYDAAQQRLTLTAPLALLNLPETTLSVPGIPPHQVSSAPGLLLNYDLYGTAGEHSTASLSAYNELRAFGRWGVVSSTSLSQWQRTDGARQSRTVRLDTGWSQSWPDRLLTLRVGDTLTGSTGWSRATRIGGIQIGSNFALQPYLVTTPVPALLGSATLPSQIDLYVNGMRQYNGQVPAGPFQLNTQPSISGAGNAQVVLTDAFGRSTTLNFSLYGTQALLKPGLTSWSAELGWVRQNYGLASNDYARQPMLSGTWRRGLSDTVTAEAHAEATKGLVNAGAGGAWLLGQAGVLTGALAHSSGAGRNGSQLNLGYHWNDRRFNVALNGSRSSGLYRDVATLYGSAVARASGSATVGFNADQAGSFSLSYLYQNYPGQTASRYVSAGWYKSLGRSTSLSVTANRDLTGRSALQRVPQPELGTGRAHQRQRRPAARRQRHLRHRQRHPIDPERGRLGLERGGARRRRAERRARRAQLPRPLGPLCRRRQRAAGFELRLRQRQRCPGLHGRPTVRRATDLRRLRPGIDLRRAGRAGAAGKPPHRPHRWPRPPAGDAAQCLPEQQARHQPHGPAGRAAHRAR